MNEQEILHTLMLSRLPRLNIRDQRQLLQQAGSASAIYAHRHNIADIVPDAGPVLTQVLEQLDDMKARAETELEFAQKNRIRCLCLNDSAYPARLRECPDAPLFLFYLGNADLNAAQVVSVVGTRRITAYGKALCADLCRELRHICPHALVVSGLAYGVDIHAHRAALEYGMQTVGVLAHGLDQIYPRLHKDTAAQMVQQGGLLTEFMTQTIANKRNFVQRNRIVAGIADAVVVVESASKGGSLITAEFANNYQREVFAFPGRAKDLYSTGCNNLIRSQSAQLITCAEDLAKALNWTHEPIRQKELRDGIQQQLFPNLSDDERKVMNSLEGTDKKHINQIAGDTGIAIGRLSSLLFEMEMKGFLKMLAGGQYQML